MEITQTGYSRKTSSHRSLRPMGRIPQITLRLWGFLCIRDAGHRGNKSLKDVEFVFLWEVITPHEHWSHLKKNKWHFELLPKCGCVMITLQV